MEKLLDEVKSLMKWHADQLSTPESVEAFFNRQLQERILGRHLGRPEPSFRLLLLSDAEIRVLEEQWQLEQIALFVPWHTQANPNRVDVPLIVFRGWDRKCLIDGFNRRNLWLANRNEGPHRVLVIEPLQGINHPSPNARPCRFFADWEKYKNQDVPYVIGILQGHRRIRANKKLIDEKGGYNDDVHVLEACFLGSLAAGRMLLEFIGIKLDQRKDILISAVREVDDAGVEMIGGTVADVARLNNDFHLSELLKGFIRMAHKAAGHMTIPEPRPWDRMDDAVRAIEGLLRECLPKPLPTLLD